MREQVESLVNKVQSIIERETSALRDELIRVVDTRSAVENELATVKAERDSLKQYKTMFLHALECVDRVFQVESKKPAPLLPDFLKLGECKFRGVERLAVAYLKAAKELEQCKSEQASGVSGSDPRCCDHGFVDKTPADWEHIEAELAEAKKSIADYQQNLGDIVTYGTTADVLDKHLQEWVARAKAAEEKLNGLQASWKQLAGFATCNSGSDGYSVSIKYKTLEQAQAAYSAMADMGKILNQESA